MRATSIPEQLLAQLGGQQKGNFRCRQEGIAVPCGKGYWPPGSRALARAGQQLLVFIERSLPCGQGALTLFRQDSCSDGTIAPLCLTGVAASFYSAPEAGRFASHSAMADSGHATARAPSFTG